MNDCVDKFDYFRPVQSAPKRPAALVNEPIEVKTEPDKGQASITEPEEDKVEQQKNLEPEMKVTILKRPSSTPSNLSLSGSGNQGASPSSSSLLNNENGNLDDPVQDLKKREENYAKARLRILGSTGMGDESPTTTTTTANVQS